MQDFNLGKWLAQEAARETLVMAGFRGEAPYITFLFFRLVTPVVMLIGTAVYVFLIAKMQQSTMVKTRALRGSPPTSACTRR